MSEDQQQQLLSIAAVVLVILGLGFFLYRQSRDGASVPEVSVQEEASARAEEVVESMGVSLSEGAERAALMDVEGGSSAGLVAVEESEGMNKYSVLASLPEVGEGEYYEVYLVADDESYELLGQLRRAKGGWMLEASQEVNEAKATKLRVTRERVLDQQPEVIVLETDLSALPGS